MTERTTILYVDDEPANLVVFRAQFQRYFEVRTASSGAEALELLDREEIPIVLSDQRMPGMTGAELLAALRQRHPHVVRMIVTAYADLDMVLASINEGSVERYILKPWDAGELRSIIASVAELYWRGKANRTLSQQVRHKERLSAIGRVALGIVRELEAIDAALDLPSDLTRGRREDHRARFATFRAGVRRLSVILDALRLYSKATTDLGTGRVVDLDQALGAVAASIFDRPPAAPASALVFERSARPILVGIDELQMEAVLESAVREVLVGAPRGVFTLAVSASSDSAVIALSGSVPVGPDVGSSFWIVLAEKLIDDVGGALSLGPGLEIRLPLYRA
jgi:CheY-like chemotaxis protein